MAAERAEEATTLDFALVAEETFDGANFYEFEALDIDGNNVSMEKYNGKVVIVSNYAQLQELYTQYGSQGLSILAFPCNQFRNQEPGTNAEIKESARNKFGLTFDFFSKVDVNGPDALPLFNYLQNVLGDTPTNDIKWNFTKFLIDRNGVPFKRYAPKFDPKVMQRSLFLSHICLFVRLMAVLLTQRHAFPNFTL
ncbi:unnamed protein product [Hydatigera taeniaeformis]|uniref:Glutathione peroxidase n=1 Tax=Hydatigena taeniaeformis TaxID=6205 RepID=A0A0R3WNV3_HYDTA|nr:unnamed protein product [Hydatigera taeniaeformis]